MKFDLLHLTPVSASFELQNSSIYFSEEPYDVTLNGKTVLFAVKTNVFSLFDLEDDTDYEVKIGEDSLSFHTPKAAAILRLSSFLKPMNGGEDDTLRIQTAIMTTPRGGVLILDEKEMHATSLFLKSHMTLVIPKGCTLFGNADKGAYPFIPGEVEVKDALPYEINTFEGDPKIGMPSLLSAYFAKDFNVVGEGTIDAQAQKSEFWIDVKKLKWARPHVVFLNHCENVGFAGVSVKNSPCWTIHPFFSDHLGFYDLKISNPKDAPNTDGLNPQSCEDVKIIGVYFSVGDDCIALKSGKYYIGKTFKRPTKDVIIRNCYMHEGHGAVVLGSEVGAGLDNLLIERCYFEHTDRGLRIKSRRGRGKDSRMTGIHFKNIIMDNVLTPITANMFYFCDPDGHDAWVQDRSPRKVDETTPYLGTFVFENMTCTNAEWALGYFYGLPEMPIESITFKNCTFTMKEDCSKGQPIMAEGVERIAKEGFHFLNVKNIRFENVKAEGYKGERVKQENVGAFVET